MLSCWMFPSVHVTVMKDHGMVWTVREGLFLVGRYNSGRAMISNYTIGKSNDLILDLACFAYNYIHTSSYYKSAS